MNMPTRLAWVNGLLKMKSTKPLLFPSDYDRSGMLRLPWLFWCVLVLQMRSFVSVMYAQAFDNVHPEKMSIFITLCSAIPALIVFGLFMNARRYWGWRVWCTGRWLLIIGQCLHLGSPFFLWLHGRTLTNWSVALFILDVLALWWLLFSQRLWACFTSEYGYPSFHYKNRIY